MTDPVDSGVRVALETSGAVGSVAVARGATVVSAVEIEARGRHASLLIPALERALADAGFGLADVTGVVVGAGPGSFTGVRVAGAAAKGLARGLGVPLWAVSSLLAAALDPAWEPDARVRYVLFDARGDRVYGGAFGVGGHHIETLIPAHGGTLREVLSKDVPPGATFGGDGAERHRGAIEGIGFRVAEGAGVPRAGQLIEAVARAALPPVPSAEAWEPDYVRPWMPGGGGP